MRKIYPTGPSLWKTSPVCTIKLTTDDPLRLFIVSSCVKSCVDIPEDGLSTGRNK
jgi:hypothetical protein